MSNVEHNEKETSLIPLEKFTLTLRHEYIDSNGTHYEIDRPIVAACAINHMADIPYTTVINKTVRDLVDFVLKEYAGTVGEEYENR